MKKIEGGYCQKDRNKKGWRVQVRERCGDLKRRKRWATRGSERHEENKSYNEDDEEIAEKWKEKELLQYTDNANSNGSGPPGDNGNTEGETRWVLGSSSGRTGGVITTSSAEDDQNGHGENFQQAFARNMRAVVTRRTGLRARKPAKFFDEAQTDSAANTMSGVYGRVTITTGTGKRYASINVRTLVMKGDKHRKEACGQTTAGAVEWVLEFETRGLGIIGLQECRIPTSGMDGTEGEYRTFYSGNAEGKRQHGVGLYMHNRVISGEFEIQSVNERIIWVYGSIYGVDQAVFSVYAPTNKKDNVAEVDKFYSTLEQQVNEVRKKYGPETKIIILGNFNARVGTDGGADNITQERNKADKVNIRLRGNRRQRRGANHILYN